jgi:hypothetical protein
MAALNFAIFLFRLPSRDVDFDITLTFAVALSIPGYSAREMFGTLCGGVYREMCFSCATTS